MNDLYKGKYQPGFIYSFKKGFSLLELMVVVLTLGMIVAFAIPSFKSQRQSSLFRTDVSRFMELLQETRALAISRGHYLSLMVGSAGQSESQVERDAIRIRSIADKKMIGQDVDYVLIVDLDDRVVLRSERLKALRMWTHLRRLEFGPKGYFEPIMDKHVSRDQYRYAFCPVSGCSVNSRYRRLDRKITTTTVLGLTPKGTSHCETGICARIALGIYSFNLCGAKFKDGQFYCL